MTWTAEERRAVNAGRLAQNRCITCDKPLVPGEREHCEACHGKKLRAARRWRKTARGRQLTRAADRLRRDARIASGTCSTCRAPAEAKRRQCRRCLDAAKVRVQLRLARVEGVIA